MNRGQDLFDLKLDKARIRPRKTRGTSTTRWQGRMAEHHVTMQMEPHTPGLVKPWLSIQQGPQPLGASDSSCLTEDYNVTPAASTRRWHVVLKEGFI